VQGAPIKTGRPAMTPYATPSRADEQREMYSAGLAADDDAALTAADLRDLANQAADTLKGVEGRSPNYPHLEFLRRVSPWTSERRWIR